MALVEMYKLFVQADHEREWHKEYFDEIIKVRQLINALSYDVYLRVCSHNLLVTITSLMAVIVSDDDTKHLSELLMKQKKIAFRLIHKRDFSETDEMLSMMEMENLTDDDEAIPPLPAAEERDALKIVDGVRKSLRDPEVLHKLREFVRSGAIGTR